MSDRQNRRDFTQADNTSSHGSLDGSWPIDSASDRGTHEVIYLNDPDFNGIELAWDRPENEWPRQNSELSFTGRKPLDFENLWSELDVPDSAGYSQVLSNYK
jgi:catechol-2,3-dioxygenase